MSTPIHYGTKYAATASLTHVQVAKLVRADIKAAVAAGELPRGKYSVTCESYSGGCSINAEVSKVEGIAVHNPERLLFARESPHEFCRLEPHSPEMAAALKRVESIIAAYNFDGSNSMVDYFHVRFYSRVGLAWEWADTAREAELAVALEAARAAEEAAPRLTFASPVLAQNDFLAHIGAL